MILRLFALFILLTIISLVFWFIFDARQRKSLAKWAGRITIGFVTAAFGLMAIVVLDRLINFVVHGS